MALPSLLESGDLPPGVHAATLEEVILYFGKGEFQRRVVARRLTRIYDLVRSTKQLRRFVIFGSFVTSKIKPADIDIILIMENSFNLSEILVKQLYCSIILRPKRTSGQAFSGQLLRGLWVENKQ